jgi:hypothetical protein
MYAALYFPPDQAISVMRSMPGIRSFPFGSLKADDFYGEITNHEHSPLQVSNLNYLLPQINS